MKLCALIEFNTCHDELFPSVVQYLNNKGFYVHIFTKKQNIEKNSLFFCKDLKYKFFKIKYWNIFRRFGIYEYFIFNSFEDYRKPEKSFIIDEIKSVKSNNKTRVLVHNSQNLVDVLNSGLSLNFIPVLISKHVVKLLTDKNIETEIVYPYYYGDFIKKSFDKQKIIFAVQGNFSNNRRNYKSLLDSVLQLSKLNQFKSSFIVKIIGRSNTKDAEEFKKLLLENDLEQYFDFCKNVENYKNFFSEINNSDYIIPLVDNSSYNLIKYFKSVSSSSINIAIAMAKPLVINKSFAESYSEFSSGMIEYIDDNLFSGMVKAISITEEFYREKVDEIEKIRNIKKSSLLSQ